MKRTATINKIDGSQEKRIFTGENFLEIKEKIMKAYPIAETELCPHDKRPGQYWIGWGYMRFNIHSVTVNI